MRLRSVSLRSASLLLILGLLPAASSNAQTTASPLQGVSLRSSTQSAPSPASDRGAGHFSTEQRFAWFVDSTIGTGSLVAGAIGAGFAAGIGTRDERGGANGFVGRYEMHLAEASAGNALEAASGAIWGEDPRYFRAPPESFGKRVRNVIRMTFVAYRGDGHVAPAYARYIGIAGGSFLANYWEPGGAASLHDAALCALGGFLGRMGGNAFQEFWPSVKPHLARHIPLVRP